MKNYFFIAIALFSFCFLPKTVLADNFTIGAGGVWRSSPYSQYDGRLIPLPYIDYDGDKFYIQGLSAGFHLWKSPTFGSFSVGLSGSLFEFKASRSKNWRLKRLNNRRATVNADLIYRISGEFGSLQASVSQDILGHSKGLTANTSYSYTFMGDWVNLTPGIGVRWDSKKQLDYYYGVSEREALMSDLAPYQAKSAFSPNLYFAAAFPFAESWNISSGIDVLFLNKNITDSPMVSRSQIYTLNLGLNYNF